MGKLPYSSSGQELLISVSLNRDCDLYSKFLFTFSGTLPN
ncbi:Uncharacterised protein [Vibrio cholerae]|nr:Uncharacterised protein [Vibrio cholerae]